MSQAAETQSGRSWRIHRRRNNPLMASPEDWRRGWHSEVLPVATSSWFELHHRCTHHGSTRTSPELKIKGGLGLSQQTRPQMLLSEDAPETVQHITEVRCWTSVFSVIREKINIIPHHVLYFYTFLYWAMQTVWNMFIPKSWFIQRINGWLRLF